MALTISYFIYLLFFEHAMDVIGIGSEIQLQILQLIAAILHIGNINFVEEKNYSAIADEQCNHYSSDLMHEIC